MKKVNSNYIREQLTLVWPDLDMVILLDSNFVVPKVSDIEKMFKASKIREMQFIPEFNDCDNFALYFLAEVRKNCYDMLMSREISPEDMFPWTISLAVCNVTRDIDIIHAVNLALCEEGIYMFDITPESDRFWKASAKSDNPFILFM